MRLFVERDRLLLRGVEQVVVFLDDLDRFVRDGASE